MSEIQQEIAAYDSMKQELESRDMAKWVVVHEKQLTGVYDSFEGAAEDAVRKFGRGPYLIRQIGAPPITLPASVMYHPTTYADDKVRI